jgi:hypothetical protein
MRSPSSIDESAYDGMLPSHLKKEFPCEALY